MQTKSNVFFLTMIVGLVVISGVYNIKIKYNRGSIEVRGCGANVEVTGNIVNVECIFKDYTHKESFNIIDRCFEVYDDGSLGSLENGNADASGRCKLELIYNQSLARTEVNGSCQSTSGETVNSVYEVTRILYYDSKNKKIRCSNIDTLTYPLKYFSEVSMNGPTLTAKLNWGKYLSKNIGNDCFSNNKGKLKFRINGGSSQSCLDYSVVKSGDTYKLRAICKNADNNLVSSEIDLYGIIYNNEISNELSCYNLNYNVAEEVVTTEIDYDKTCHFTSISSENPQVVEMNCLNQSTGQPIFTSKNIGTCFSYDNGNLSINNSGGIEKHSKCSSRKAYLENGVLYYTATCKNSSSKNITTKIKMDFLKNLDGVLNCQFPAIETKLLADYEDKKIIYTCASPSISDSSLSMYCWNSSNRQSKISTINIGKDCLSNLDGKLTLKQNGGSNGSCKDYSISKSGLTYTLKAKCKPTPRSSTYNDTQIELNSFLFNNKGTLTCDIPSS